MVTLTNTGGATTNSVCDTTMSGPFNSTDADTGNAPDSASSGTDKSIDNRQDKDQATITLEQDGTLDTSGNLTLTGGEGEDDGTDQFNQVDTTNAPTYENPIPADPPATNPNPNIPEPVADESVVDVDKNKGNETFNVDSGSSQAGGGLISLFDKEKITSNVNDLVTVTPSVRGWIQAPPSLAGL